MLAFFLPFYIIKYEKEKLTLTDNPSRLLTLLDEYTFMKQSLNHEPLFHGHSELYRYMIDLIKRIINYIFAGIEPVRKGLNDIMGGKVLELETDRISGSHMTKVTCSSAALSDKAKYRRIRL